MKLLRWPSALLPLLLAGSPPPPDPHTGRYTAPGGVLELHRGPEGAPIFLVNHWITTDPVPLPSNASRVNAYHPLLARLRECERLRRHLTNLVSVNFYLRGDLFQVVDKLNRIN